MGIRGRYALGEQTTTRGRAFRVRTSMESMGFLNVAISLTIFGGSRGWRWVMDHIQKGFVFRGGFIIRSLGSQQALLMTRYEITRQ